MARDADGRVVFVPYTAPGDRVRVRLVEQRARHARGRVETLLVPGASRVEPACPAFGRCGGCAWQHVAYPEQLRAKRAIVEDALVRIAHLSRPAVEVVASPLALGYRHRARLQVRAGRVGYHGRRSHRLEPVDRCPVLAPALDAALQALAQDPPLADGELELDLGEEGVRAVATSATGRERPADAIVRRAGPDRLRISPRVFFQANASLHEALATAVLDAAGRGARALELYAGAGFFTLRLARRFEALTALEADPRAVADLRANLATAGCERVRVIAARLEEALASLPRADAVVLDPPRTGLPPGASAAIAGLGARRIVYLSCDPATLARDVAALVEAGYRPARVTAFDLFPQTPHVEVLAQLEPAAASAADGREAVGFVHSAG